jgi:5-methylcytosine-specific restriction endonuclease McrA
MGLKRSRLVLTGKAYKALCREVFTRDGWRCKICRAREGLHAHHIKFRSHGGDDIRSNLLTVCSICHEAIHQRYVIVRDKLTRLIYDVNADTGVYCEFLSGWRPRGR